MQAFLLVFLGAGIGGSLRHGVNLLALRHAGSDFPYGTLIINVAGSFVMGILAAWFASKAGASTEQPVKLFLMTGVLGGFTTFSSFSLQTLNLLREHAWWQAGSNVLLSVTLCLIAVAIGFWSAVQISQLRA